MGKKAIYKFISFMILVVTMLMATFTLFGIFGGSADPTSSTALAMLVYILPILIAGNVITLIFWSIRRHWHWTPMPIIAILFSIPYMGTLYQVKIFKGWKNTSNALTVATYNVARFGRETSGFKAEDILSEMKKHEVDILCMQEYLNTSGDKLNSDKYKEKFPFMATGYDDMVIYSRYPIKDFETISFGSHTNNSAMWADISIKGKMVRVFNVHLETTGFNRTIHNVAKIQAQGLEVEENSIIRALWGNYTMGMAVRAQQADMVAKQIADSPHPVIVCGDFNDVPYSYVYKTMLGDLEDGFKECGEGFMFTYRGAKSVRIDYIFHDKSMDGIDYYKQNLSYSDHYPVYMEIAL